MAYISLDCGSSPFLSSISSNCQSYSQPNCPRTLQPHALAYKIHRVHQCCVRTLLNVSASSWESFHSTRYWSQRGYCPPCLCSSDARRQQVISTFSPADHCVTYVDKDQIIAGVCTQAPTNESVACSDQM